jgi:hypothetical protein
MVRTSIDDFTKWSITFEKKADFSKNSSDLRFSDHAENA